MNLKTPRVSVIVTTYNRKEYLRDTIQSILNQTCQDFELIVVDNYSNYDYFTHIESFNSDKIRAYQNHNNGIIAVNRNVGISHAKGEFIAFCDDDDIWINNKLEKQIEFQKKTMCDLVYTDSFLFNDIITNIKDRTFSKNINNLKNLISSNPIATSSVLVVNKDLYFNDNPNLLAIEDYSLWLDLYIKGYSFGFLNVPLIYYRIGHSNTSLNKKMWIIQHLKLIYLHSSLLIKNPLLPIKFQIVKEVSLNLLKFSVKGFFNQLKDE